MGSLIAWVDGRRAGEFFEQRLADGSLFAFEYSADATSRDLISLTMIPAPASRRLKPAPFRRRST